MMTRTHGTEDISIRFQFRMNYAINMGCNPYCKKSPWMVWAPQTYQQLISSFEYRPDGTVLLSQPSLVILLSHFWRWRGNSTSHSLSSPTSSPYSHTNADKALRGESASSRRFAVSFLPPEAPSQAALLPPISFPLSHSSFLRPPVCSVNGSGDCSVNSSGDCSVNESVSGSIGCSFNGSVDCSFDFPFSRLRWCSCRFSLIAAANSRSTSSVRHFVTSHPRMML